MNNKLTVWKEQNTPKIFLLLEEHSDSVLVFIHTTRLVFCPYPESKAGCVKGRAGERTPSELQSQQTEAIHKVLGQAVGSEDLWIRRFTGSLSRGRAVLKDRH